MDQLHGLTSLLNMDVLLFSRFSGVVFRCSWFSPVIWEFFILFVFTFVTVIFVFALPHGSLLSMSNRDDLTNIFLH